MHRTNPDSLKNCRCFRVFRLNFSSDFQFAACQISPSRDDCREAYILSKDATTRLGWELNHRLSDLGWELNHQLSAYGRCKADAPNHSATLPTRPLGH